MTMQHQRHELLREIEDYTSRVLADHGVDSEVAGQAGVALADFLAEHWGGQLINFPKDYNYKLHQRDIEIYEQFQGNNHTELSRRYGIGVRAIYKIVSRCRKRDLDHRQPKLF